MQISQVVKMKDYKPIIEYDHCNEYIVVYNIVKYNSINSMVVSNYFPINSSMRDLETMKTPTNLSIYNITDNKKILSVVVDLESNGHQITEIGILVYNKDRILYMQHEHFKTDTETMKGRERFVHKPHKEPSYFFSERRQFYLDILIKCKYVIVKGRYLESKIFPEIKNKIIDLSNVNNFPKIDDIQEDKILHCYKIVKPYLSLTESQTTSEHPNISEIRHNPLIECYTFWFIMNNIFPKLFNIFYNSFV